MEKLIFFILSVISSILFTSCSLFNYLISYYDYKELETGFCMASYNEEIVIGSGSTDNPAGMITILKRIEDNWKVTQIIDMKDVAYKKRGPMNFAINDKFLVTGIDNITGKSGLVLVFIKNGDNWEKAYTIKSPMKEKDDLFGYSLAIYEDKLLVGTEAGKNGGKAYLFNLKNYEYELIKVFYPPEKELNRKFGRLVLMNSDYIIISDPHIYHELNNKNGVNGTVYIYDRENYTLLDVINNINVTEKSHYSWLGTNGIIDDNNLLLTIRGEKQAKLFIIHNKMLSNKEKQITIDLDYDPIGSISYWSSNCVSLSKNILVVENKIFCIEGGQCIKTNEIPDCYVDGIHLEDNLLLLFTGEHDNQEKRIEQKQKRNESMKYGGVYPEVDKPINLGRVHIMRIAPDGSYTEEAIIARRTNAQDRIEFYDMLHDE